MLQTPYFVRLPGVGKVIDTMITIPFGIDFDSLKLVKLPGGEVTGDKNILDAIGKANNVDIGDMGRAAFIAHWYRSHLESGGKPVSNQQELQSFFDGGLGYLVYPDGTDFNSLGLEIEGEESYYIFKYNHELLDQIRELNEISADESDDEVLDRLCQEEIKKGGMVNKLLEERVRWEANLAYLCRATI